MSSSLRLIWVSAILLCLAACGGGGGGDGAAAAAAGPAAPAAPASLPANVKVSGAVTFDLVPAVPGRGLDYASTASRPARGVTVELLGGGAVLGSTTTDAAGAYSFDVAASTQVSLRVRAELLRVGAPSWEVTVVDNVAGSALYTLAGTVFDTGVADSTRNLHAASGWDGSSYTAARSAAPFAILDVVYDAMQLVLTAAPGTAFPQLRVHWSPSNVPVPGPGPGEIGGSLYRPGVGIFLVGAADQDADEYDRHVIAHEWGHYLEHQFSRSDSIGGRHSLTDQLDMRLAFGEAWGNAFSAMATGESIYTDAFGPSQAHSFSFDLEQSQNQANLNPGWFNERSLQSLLFDLYDNGRDGPPKHAPLQAVFLDDLALGFAPLFEALTNQQRATEALTTIFPVVNALKSGRPADASLIDGLMAWERIDPVLDDYGSTQDNYGVPTTQRDPEDVSADFNSIYDSLTVDGPAVNVCSLDDYASTLTGAVNKLASRRFVRFTVTTPGPHVITARAVAPLNAAADPDLELHVGGGVVLSSTDPPSCTVDTPQDCVEMFAPTLEAGNYVLEVYEWTNTNDTDDEYPPIGRTCFDVTVAR